GSDLAPQASGRGPCRFAGADRACAGAGGAGIGIGAGSGELLRGGIRRVLAAPASDGGGDYQPRVRSGQYCSGAAGPTGEDGPHRWRAFAAHAMAHWRGEPRVVRIVRVPSAEQEDARRDTRERQRLITEQTAHTNRIKALLRLLGMAVGNPRRRDWLIWLAAQRDWQGQPVPPRLAAELEREHARLMLVREQLEAL